MEANNNDTHILQLFRQYENTKDNLKFVLAERLVDCKSKTKAKEMAREEAQIDKTFNDFVRTAYRHYQEAEGREIDKIEAEQRRMEEEADIALEREVEYMADGDEDIAMVATDC